MWDLHPKDPHHLTPRLLTNDVNCEIYLVS